MLFDTSVLLDLITVDPAWYAWSNGQLQTVLARGDRVLVNPITFAECSPAFASADEMDLWFDPQLYELAPLPYSAAWGAAQAFLKYRRTGGVRTAPMPDFYIGAHAEAEGHTVVTRDASRFRTYFPRVPLRTPPS